MAGYLKEYRMADMRAMLRNGRTPHARSSASLAGKTALVTGGTSGVGLAAARELARGGADLILLARNEAKARAVASELGADSGCSARFYLADFADLAQVRQIADRIAEREPRLDILVNSAGMHSTRRRRTSEGHELVFCVNHLAPFLITLRLISLLKRSAPARIIQVSSQGHRFNGLDVTDLDWRRRRYTGLRGYGASKTAQLLTVWELSDRLRGSGVTINAMHPGEVQSAIGNNNGRFYAWYKRHVLWRTLKDPAISGESIYYLAADPALDLPLEYVRSQVSVGVADRVIAVETKDSLGDYRRLLESFYPESRADIERIMDVIRRIMKDMDVLYGIDNPLFKDLTSDYSYVLRTLIPWSLRFLLTIGRINRMNGPIEELLASLTTNESLRSIVGQHFFRSTPAFFAMSYFSVYLDYLYPKGGTGTLMDLLADYARGKGASSRTGTGGVRLDPDRRTIACDDGSRHEYGSLVWAADLNALYASIDLSRVSDPRDRRRIAARRDELARHEGGDSVFSVFLAVDEPPEYFASKSHGHFFYTPDPRGLGDRRTRRLEELVSALEAGSAGWDEVAAYLREFLARNTFEISIPVLKDPAMAPPGKTGLIVSWLFDYRLTELIRERGWYDEVRELCMDEAVRILSASVYPGIDAKVEDRFATTPHSIAGRTGSTGGAITGWELGPAPVPVVHKMQQVSAAVTTPVPGVFKAGQWAYSPSGLPIALLTGKLAAQRAVRGPRGPRRSAQ